MSDTLDTFVRLKQFELDEKRRALKEVQDQQDATCAEIARIEQSRSAEAEKAKSDPALLQAFADFAAMAKFKIDGLQAFLAELEPAVEKARLELEEAFGAYKKAEISRDNRHAAAQDEQEKKDQREMDELGMQGHRRLKHKDFGL